MSNFTSQGVIAGSFQINGVSYYEIFDVELGYLFANFEDTDLMVSTETWVKYEVIKVRNGIRNMQYQAKKVEYMEENRNSSSPATNVFRNDNKHNFNVRESINYFQFDTNGNYLTFKGWVKYFEGAGQRKTGYYHEYYGFIEVAGDELRKLREFKINDLEVKMKLKPYAEYMRNRGQSPWIVIHYMNKGESHGLGGFLSVSGLNRRGPGGRPLPKDQVLIPPDSLRPMHEVRNSSQPSSSNNWQSNNNNSAKNQGQNVGFGAIFGKNF
ncbi:unnamed protein product [Caenorhabditis angaria]|uniref:Uncharacterized protein n=1 Tax=Caenorhabditis angaria TaxID=860376 RepID=A0A9P1IRE1_9PELO|nr:unnamed protein product [Caenorhabditis angaria]